LISLLSTNNRPSTLQTTTVTLASHALLSISHQTSNIHVSVPGDIER
jgi:hypothetical protein